MTEAPRETAPAAPAPVTLQVRFTRPMLALLAALVVLPWLIAAGLLIGPLLRRDAVGSSPGDIAGETTGQITEGQPGPWGDLEYVPLTIELPDEFVIVRPPGQSPVRWFFKGGGKEEAIERLRAAGLTDEQVETIQKVSWSVAGDGATVQPGDDLILGLSPAARAKTYAMLIESEENRESLDSVWFRPGEVDYRIAGSGLAPSSVDLLKRLLYPRGPSLLLFSDVGPALRTLPDDSERHRFVKTIHRKKTLLLQMKIDAHSDVRALANYWGVGGRQKDLVPLLNAMRLNSLRGIEAESRIHVVCLLPPFVRERLYNYPFANASPTAVKENAFWSALNFFSSEPDNRFNDMEHVQETLKRDYYGIGAPSQLGDLIVLTAASSGAVHAAAYVADDVVFTKNGDAANQPWLLMHQADMIDTHSVRYPASDSLKALYFRRKSG